MKRLFEIAKYFQCQVYIIAFLYYSENIFVTNDEYLLARRFTATSPNTKAYSNFNYALFDAIVGYPQKQI